MPAKPGALALSLTALTITLAAIVATPLASAQDRRPTRFSRAYVSYDAPDVTLIDLNGDSVQLPELLESDGPVVLQFFFTTCRGSCPVLSSALAKAQAEIATGPGSARLLSISIDPEHDTPERLREYAAKRRAGPRWGFFTGDPDDIVAVQKAFGVYHENKQRHPPTTLLRNAGDGPWLRLDGFIKSPQLVAELESLRSGDSSSRR